MPGASKLYYANEVVAVFEQLGYRLFKGQAPGEYHCFVHDSVGLEILLDLSRGSISWGDLEQRLDDEGIDKEAFLALLEN